MAKIATGALRGENAKVGSSPYGKPSKKGEPKTEDLSKTLLLIDPTKITTFRHKDRQPEELEDDPTFHELVAEFENGGINVQPILIRPYRPAPGEKPIPGIEYEEIFGYKRHQAALRAKRAEKQVLCVFEDLSDEEAHTRMVKENKSRSGLAAWSKAMSWNNALSNKLSTKAKLAADEGVEEETIDAYLRVLEIVPDRIIKHIDMHKLGIEALFELRSALLKIDADAEKQKRYEDLVIENAQVVASRKATKTFFANLYEKVSPSSGAGKAIEPRTLSSGRNKLVTLKPGKTGYTVTVHRTAAKALDLEEFEKLVAEALDKKGVKLS